MKTLALSLLLAAALAGCAATKATLNPTRVNPGSVGTVVAKETSNGNTKLDVDINHLPPPGALGANTYVVWIRPHDGKYLNLGQVAIDERRHGHLETTTPHQSFIVIVTGEDNPTAAVPSSTVVLTGVVDNN